jgi:hypothetical protein
MGTGVTKSEADEKIEEDRLIGHLVAPVKGSTLSSKEFIGSVI